MTAETQFDGRVAVVAGGASGIGQACALELARRGAAVAILDLNEATGAEAAGAARGHGVPAELFVTDVSSPESVGRAAAQVTQRFKAVDMLINSAGIQRYGTALDTEPETWDEVMAINVKSMYLTARALLPSLIEQRGAIVNVSSCQALGALKNSLAYVASKHAALGLTRAMAADHAPHVRVNCVAPGAIDTPMLRASADLFAGTEGPEAVLDNVGRMHPLERIGQAEEVARAVAFLAGPDASFITGACLTVDGGVTALLRL